MKWRWVWGGLLAGCAPLQHLPMPTPQQPLMCHLSVLEKNNENPESWRQDTAMEAQLKAYLFTHGFICDNAFEHPHYKFSIVTEFPKIEYEYK